MAIAKRTFNNSNLDGSYRLVWNHNLNTTDVIPTLYDNDLIQGITSDLFALGDATGADKPNNITLSMSGPITGTWTLLMNYVSAGESGAGRRAFELSTTATPTDDMRVIIGKEATPSLNMTFTQLFAHLLTKLGFLKLSENLNDLTDKSQSRINLGVYSTTETDNALSTKASLYQAGSGSVLGVANTAVFNPSANYHPATKKYADDLGATKSTCKLLGKVATDGTLSIIAHGTGITCSRISAGVYRITHNFGHTNYSVFTQLTPVSFIYVWPFVMTKGTTTFDVQVVQAGIGHDVAFDIAIFTV